MRVLQTEEPSGMARPLERASALALPGREPALRRLFKVEREERDNGYPKLVSSRCEVRANECGTPRELNASEAHTFFLRKSDLAWWRSADPLPCGASVL